jgi:hypothetical protein
MIDGCGIIMPRSGNAGGGKFGNLYVLMQHCNENSVGMVFKPLLQYLILATKLSTVLPSVHVHIDFPSWWPSVNKDYLSVLLL